MATIHKFSLVYDAAEDRLAWDAEDSDGGTARLWLTQRLSRDLVLALIPRLPKAAAAQDIAPEYEATVQSWEQAAAMSEFGKTSSVTVRPESTSGLVTAVHITPSDTGMTLAFDFGAGEQRTIAMDAQAVRQTLTVMHGLYVAAGWPTEFWPPWVSQPAAASTVTALN